MNNERYTKVFEHFAPVMSFEETQEKIREILTEGYERAYTKDTLCFLHSTIDLTSLSGSDTEESIQSMVMSVNEHSKNYPDIPNVAAICVYPLQVPVVQSSLKAEGVKIAAVTGGFPASQTFEEIKYAETSLTVHAGANEIDIVMNRNYFFAKDFDRLTMEIEEQKNAARGASLKLILETGMLRSLEEIRQASLLALFSGADFIKTSTGKEGEGATLESVFVMCQVIKEYYKMYNKRIGIKVSGGVRSAEQAVEYYTLIRSILGEEWVTPSLFRIGASSLAGAIKEKIQTL